jgi:hypothetical protein
MHRLDTDVNFATLIWWKELLHYMALEERFVDRTKIDFGGKSK